MPDRQVTDRLPLLEGDPGRVELGEVPSIGGEDSERAVPRTRDLRAQFDDPLQDGVERVLARERKPGLDPRVAEIHGGETTGPAEQGRRGGSRAAHRG